MRSMDIQIERLTLFLGKDQLGAMLLEPKQEEAVKNAEATASFCS